MQHVLQLFRVFPVPGLADHFHVHAEDVRHNPSPLVHDVLYRDPDAGQHSTELGDPARSIGHGHCKLQKPALRCQSTLQTPTQDRRVDVASAQKQHHSVKKKRKEQNERRFKFNYLHYLNYQIILF